MAQFDLHAVGGDDALYAPYLVELQSSLIDGLDTVVSAPLVELTNAGPMIRKLNPVIDFGGQEYVLRTAELVSLPRSALGTTRGNIANQRDAVMAALDILFYGF